MMILQCNIRILILLLGAFTVTPGDDDKSDAEEKYQVFAKQATDYVIREQGAGRQLLELRPEALLNWGNPIRQQERGSVFVWLLRGRPRVIGSIFTYELNGSARIKHEFHSLSDQPLVMTRQESAVWTPASQPIQWRALEQAPAPSANDRQRLVEMRGLARRFRARLIDPNGDRTELRLMPQPLLRYSSREANVLEGAIFSFVVATDPEAFLLIEAAGTPGDERWRFAFARFHYWALSAELDDRPAWSVEPDLSQATHYLGDAGHHEKPYVSFHPQARTN